LIKLELKLLVRSASSQASKTTRSFVPSSTNNAQLQVELLKQRAASKASSIQSLSFYFHISMHQFTPAHDSASISSPFQFRNSRKKVLRFFSQPKSRQLKLLRSPLRASM
jgi:hypothetical protein